MRLQGNGTTGSHGVIWEALLVLDLLLSHVEASINTLSQQESEQQPGRRGRHSSHTNPLLICFQNAWEVLTKYNDQTDKNHEIYAAAALLNPCLRKRYFERSWTGDAAIQIEAMITKNRGIWESQYAQNTPTAPPVVHQSSLSAFIAQMQAPDTQAPEDEFSQYIDGRQTPATDWKANNLFRWWANCEFPTLRQWAFDTLSIPAMSAELERVFSQAKRTITDDRNRLAASTFEALQCMKHWTDHGLYKIGTE